MNTFQRQLVLTEEQHNRIVTLCGSHPDLVEALNKTKRFTAASSDQIKEARTLCHEELEVDDDADISDPENGEGVWVSAWLWVPQEHPDEVETEP